LQWYFNYFTKHSSSFRLNHVQGILKVFCTGGKKRLKAGAALRILRWEYKTGFASEASEKKLYPSLFQMWGVQASKYQYLPAEYIEIRCLETGCRINKHRQA